jgi:flagellar biosynthetic protein FliR
MSAELPVDAVLGWLLSSVRLLALFAVAPLFGNLAIPPRVRLGLALVVAWAIAPAPPAGAIQGDALHFAGLVVGEALIGVAIGFAAQLIFHVFGLLGEFLSTQGGIGAARMIDPTSGISSVALAVALQDVALLTYLGIGGHHALLRGAAESFARLPVGGSGPPAGAFLAIAGMGSVIYSAAARLALPVTVALLVTNAALGLLGRAIPQLNLMTLQLPAHVAGLLLLLALGATALIDETAALLLPWTGRAVGVVVGTP